MKAGWKTLIVAGVVLVVLRDQVMAQPWGGGPGRGQGRFRGPGRGGPGPMGQQWGPQDGRGAWRAPGAGQDGPGAWCPLGLDRGAMRGLLGRRLNLTPEQREKIRSIVEESRSRVQARIKEVLTEEQRRQLQPMQDRAGQFNRPMQRPGAGMRGGGTGAQGQGVRGRLGARGQSMGPRGQGWGGPGMQNWGPQRGLGMRQPPVPSVGGGPTAGGRRQGMGPAQQDGALPLGRLFDRADANDDGTLTREELKAFQDTMRRGLQPPQ